MLERYSFQVRVSGITDKSENKDWDSSIAQIEEVLASFRSLYRSEKMAEHLKVCPQNPANFACEYCGLTFANAQGIQGQMVVWSQ